MATGTVTEKATGIAKETGVAMGMAMVVGMLMGMATGMLQASLPGPSCQPPSAPRDMHRVQDILTTVFPRAAFNFKFCYL